MPHDSDVTQQAGLESFPAPREIALALLFFCMLAVIFTWPILARFDNWGIQDWDQHLFYQDAPRTMLLQYGQFPLWNPYYGGGMPMLANPQSTFLSPVWIFVLIFGAVRGVKLEIVFYLVAGLLGVYLLGPVTNSREERRSPHQRSSCWAACMLPFLPAGCPPLRPSASSPGLSSST